MNPNKFFEKAEQNQVKPFELVYRSSTSLSLKVYMDELENYEIASDGGMSCRGIYNGKLGSFRSDRTDSKVVDTAIEAVKSSAKFGHEGNPDFFIAKGMNYKRVYGYSRTVEEVSPETLIAVAKKISSDIRKADSRITVAEVHVSKTTEIKEHYNTMGLALKAKANGIIIWAEINIRDGEKVESAFKIALVDDWSKFDADKFVFDVVRNGQAKLGADTIPSGKYDVIFDHDVIPGLLQPLLNQLSAFAVKEHLSLFEGKVGQQVFSKKLTFTENPHVKGLFCSSFDAEGMPTVKKNLVTAGVVDTYLYDLDTALQSGKHSTGNAASSQGNIRPKLGYVEVRKGRLGLEEMAAKLGKGLYITSLQGLHSGYNVQSGDFSLQAEGFLIEDGKISKPVTLITVAGNVLKDFNRVICVGSDLTVTHQGMATPSIAVRKLSVSGS